MASKVNVGFVVKLGVGLAITFGVVVGAAFFLLRNSPSDLERLGDKAMASKNYGEAAVFFSKAVDREKTNVRFLEKWRDSIAAMTPQTQLQFGEAFNGWVSSLRQLGIAQPKNHAAQALYLDIRRRQLDAGPFDRQACLMVANEAKTMLDRYAGDPPGPWEGLKKYRGLATMRIASNTADSTAQDWESARADLEAALRAAPDDHEPVLLLEQFYSMQADRAERAGNRPEADSLVAKGTAVIEQFAKAHPDHVLAKLASLRRDMSVSIRQFQIDREAAAAPGSTAAVPDPVKASQEYVKKVLPRLDDAAAAARRLAEASPEKIDINTLGMLRQMEQAIDPEAKGRRTRETLAAVLAKRPTADLLMLDADLAADLDDFARAIDTAQRLLDLPPATVSFEGGQLFTQKAACRFLQVVWSVKAYLAAPEGEKAAWRTKIDERRQKLADIEAKDSPRMVLADAWAAYSKEQWAVADDNLARFQQLAKAMDVESMTLWAQVAVRRDQPGAARERLRSVLAQQPANVPAAIALGSLELSMQRYSEARVIYDNLAKLYPSEAAFSEKVKLIDALLTGKSSDPVAQILLDADQLRRESAGKPDSAQQVATFLERKLKDQPPDVRLFLSATQAWVAAGQRDKALDVATRGRAALPKDKQLEAVVAQLSASDPIEGDLAVIDMAEAPALEKALQKYTILKAAGRVEQAKQAIEAMRAADPQSVKLLEVEFLEAMEARDYANAEKFAERAVKTNADAYEGKTYRARLAAAKGDFTAAITLMQEVLTGGATQPETWRLLGRFQLAAGRAADAAGSFRKALELRPADAPGAVDLLRALLASQQREQALAAARDSSKYPAAQANAEFVDLWLALEQEFGDRTLVRDRRERLSVADPKNRGNWASLAQVYMRAGDYAKAKAAIDKVRELGDDVDAVELQALYHWGQNEPDKARTLFTGYLGAREGREKLAAAVRYAQFLLDRGDLPACLSTLDAARTLQDAKAMEVDKTIVDVLFRANRFPDAVPVIRRVIEGGADTPEQLFRKRLVESLMRAAQYDEADKELAAIIAGKEPDMVSLLLQAEIRTAAKDRKAARAIYDRAVARWPSEATVFVKRGQFLAGDEATLKDAIADYTKAIQLAPNASTTYRLRAGALNLLPGDETERRRNLDAAIADLRRALTLTPNDEELMVGLVSDLLRLKRDSDAEAAVNECLANRPREAPLLARVGDLFAGLKRNLLASKYYEQAFMIDPSDPITQRFLDSMLSEDGLDLAKAERVLASLGDRVPKNPGFTMALAKIRLRQGRTVEAGRNAIDAVRLLDPNTPGIMLAWHNDMRRLLPEAARYDEFLDKTIKQGLVPTCNEWFAYFRGLIATGDATVKPETLEVFRKLGASAQNQHVKLLAIRSLGASLYQNKDYTNAAAAFEAGLKLFPTDLEMLNNLAYILAKDLGRPADAAPYAERLDAQAGNSADILDTVGYVYLRAGRAKEAEARFRKALGTVESARTAVSICSHLAEVLIRTGEPIKKTEAAELLQRAESLMQSATTPIDDQVKAELAEVKALLAK